MRYSLFFFILLLTALPGWNTSGAVTSINQQHTGALGVIDWPVTGEHIQGAVVIRGSTPNSGMRSYEVGYAQSSDPNQNWVLIQEGTTPIQDGILAVWDTTYLPDGEYNLRLLINQTNGDQSVTNMYNLIVQNDLSGQIADATPTAWYANLPSPSATPTTRMKATLNDEAAYLSPTPTSLPDNPVEISPDKVMTSLGIGAILSISAFLIIGGYLGIRYWLNGRT
jgi:hypothetical protein